MGIKGHAMLRVHESHKPKQTLRDLSDDQWATFHVLIPDPPRWKDGRQPMLVAEQTAMTIAIDVQTALRPILGRRVHD